MLMLRVITACVLLAILLLAIWIGPLAFAGVMAIAFGAVLFEWLRMTGLGPVPAIVVASVEMITQFSLYWAGALPRMSWFLFLVNGAVMIAWFVIFFAELFHRDTGFHVTVRQSSSPSCSSSGAPTFRPISAAAPGASTSSAERSRPTRLGKERSEPT